MDENELKAAFAAFLLETPDQPLEAALKIYPADKDRGLACRIAFAWPKDPAVILEKTRLLNEGEFASKVPSKDQVISEMWALAQNEKVAPKDRAAMSRLIAEMLGYIAKPADSDVTPKRMPSVPVYKIVKQ